MQAISLYWFATQQQTSTLTPQKFGFFYAKFSAEFNEISLFFWKQQEKVEKMAITNVVQKNANKCRSETKG